MRKIGARIKRRPDFSDEISVCTDIKIKEIIEALTELAGAAVFMQGKEVSALIKDGSSFIPVSSAFTPDHIVYAGSEPLFTEANTSAGVRGAWGKFNNRTGRSPKIIAVRRLGIFGAAAANRSAQTALDLFRDAIKIAVFSESFGGPLFMTEDKIDFINNWEVERYRANVSAKS
jgi:rhamnose utilization protein RhaD (predicted bifunctional aldolase and dehydrogenase)